MNYDLEVTFLTFNENLIGPTFVGRNPVYLTNFRLDESMHIVGAYIIILTKRPSRRKKLLIGFLIRLEAYIPLTKRSLSNSEAWLLYQNSQQQYSHFVITITSSTSISAAEA